ncbi:hypothetical protein LTR84_007145 [Exophiala bonariae]|uniref:Serine carboxypeptidase S28 n=1 Tax=Exophiala bonariae TaxID=1690606 RepID=A0AAV9N0R5_9EURO|nr:hypothetical protein LTR84_007145 [Exophiala bonariae]
MKLNNLLSICSLYCIYHVHARDQPRAIPPRTSKLDRRSDETSPPTLNIEVPIDHFSNDSEKFNTRYWVNATYYKPGGPVIFIDPGENVVNQALIDMFLVEATLNSSGMTLARNLGGLALVIENRFYGESLPYPVDDETGLLTAGWGGYQYFTVDQSLEDLVYIAQNFQPPGLEAYWDILKPSASPWIYIGGSYPGIRAAFSRISHPEIWYAAWVSSAPVQTQLRFEAYYDQLAEDMTKNCSLDIHAAVEYTDQILRSGTEEEIVQLKAALTIANQPELLAKGIQENYNDAEIAALVANLTEVDTARLLLSVLPPNVQSTGFDEGMLPYCTGLESYDPAPSTRSPASIFEAINITVSNDLTGTISEGGVAAKFGQRAAFDATVSMIYHISVDLEAFADTLGSVEGNPRAWEWQSCYELGYAQTANTSNPRNIASSFLNLTTWLNDCHTNFDFPELPETPDTERLLKYGGWNMTPSNVMFTDGLKDPWHILSVQSTAAEYGAPNRRTTDQIPACNKAPSGSDVFGILYPNGYHINDLSKALGAENTTADEGTALFLKALDEWLPCFHSA